MPLEGDDKHKRLGVTHSIRNKLNFLDERLWKRFSARRLELIDTLDLSSKKASEQEDEINRVAELLRIEFNYGPEAFQDFDKLVRAAVQSVRRNRKRSSKSKNKSKNDEQDSKRQKFNDNSDTSNKVTPYLTPPNYLHHEASYNNITSITNSNANDNNNLSNNVTSNHMFNATKNISSSNSSNNSINSIDSLNIFKTCHTPETDNNETSMNNKFISEIFKLNSDSQEEIYDLNYSRSQNFSILDKSRNAINSMIKPRVPLISKSKKNSTNLPSISNLDINSSLNQDFNTTAKSLVLSYFERSKTCSESISKRTDNLEILGKNTIAASIEFVFEKSFEKFNQISVEYLRTKLNQEQYLARVFRNLDEKVTKLLNDETVVLTFNTLIGSCIKDFGFDAVIFPLCEIFYLSILESYPLISKSSIPFKCRDYLKPFPISNDSNYADSLNSLATIASDIKLKEQLCESILINQHKFLNCNNNNINNNNTLSYDLNIINQTECEKKQVKLKFLSSVLEFSYPTKNSSTPRFIELVENARSAFKLPVNDIILGLKNLSDNSIINSDLDLEKIFKTQEKIELEIFIQKAKEIPIYEITSTIIPNKYRNDSPKIILPPPFKNLLQLTHKKQNTLDHITNGNQGIKFLSNSEDITPPPPPPPSLPKFQPLL